MTTAIEGELARLRREETHRSVLRLIESRYSFGEIAARMFIPLNKIEELKISSSGKATTSSLRLREGTNSLELTNLQDVTWWYGSGSLYNVSSGGRAFNFKVGQLVTEVQFSDLLRLSTDIDGKTTIALKNGETYTGSIHMESGLPLAITGKLASPYGGFPADAIFVLSDITSIQPVQ